MGRKKTYVSTSISNLNTDGEEIRYAQLCVFQNVLYKLSYVADATMDAQRGDYGPGNGAGVLQRNYIIWARDKSFADYDDEDKYGTYDGTFNNLIGMSSPSISISVDTVDEATLQEILAIKCGISLNEQTLTNQRITVDGITDTGQIVQVTITTDVTITKKVSTEVSHVGAYDLEKLALAYIYEHGSSYVNGWLGYGIISGDEFVTVSSGDSATDVDYDEDEDELESVLNPNYETTEGDNVDLTGDANDAWLFWGYNTTEDHIDEETNETVTETVFNQEEDEYIYLSSWLDSKISNRSSSTTYYVLAGYVYSVYKIDAYETDSNGLILVQLNETTQTYEPRSKIDGETMTLLHYYSWELEDYQSTYTASYYSQIDLDTIEFFSLVLDNDVAAVDDVLGSTTTTEVSKESLLFSPPIVYMRSKTWTTYSNNACWYWYNWRASYKALGDKDNFDETLDSLQETLTDSNIAWVYEIFGLPTNMCQLSYCARYGIQFFKMLGISDWGSITIGEDYSVSGGSRTYDINATSNSVNYKVRVGWSSTYYCTGSGICPVPGDNDIIAGRGGYASYNNRHTLWRQATPDTWEYIQISGYYFRFRDIKNGKSETVASDGWSADIWEVEQVTRNYSKCLIPISKTVASYIPIADFTDLMQYCYNIGVTAYKVVKKKWYQTGLFKIILVIIIIIITVIVSIYSGPQNGAYVGSAGAGFLATAQALLWDIIVNVAVSMVVGYLLQIVIAPILTSIFGDIIGELLTTVLTIVVSYYTGGALGTVDTSSTSILDKFMSPLTWLDMLNQGIELYVQKIYGKIEDIQNKMEELEDTYEERTTEIEEAWAAMLGDSNNELIKIVQKGIREQEAQTMAVVESASNFISKKLMYGADIADLTVYTLENYVELNLNTQPYSKILSSS